VPVHAFVEDVAASGGYWIAAAADEIVADRVSILGSIGVIAGGFGAPEALARWGRAAGLHRRPEQEPARPVPPRKPRGRGPPEAAAGPDARAFIDHVRPAGAKLAGADLFTGSSGWARKR
jgi:hypothetical protein